MRETPGSLAMCRAPSTDTAGASKKPSLFRLEQAHPLAPGTRGLLGSPGSVPSCVASVPPLCGTGQGITSLGQALEHVPISAQLAGWTPDKVEIASRLLPTCSEELTVGLGMPGISP